MSEEDKSSSATLEGKEAAADTTPSKDNGKEDKGDPADRLTPEHPRFQEIYGKLKTTERKYEAIEKALQDKETDINLLRQHNQQLAESISSVHKKMDKASEKAIPNPIEDPEGYAKHLDEKLESDRKQLQLEQQMQRHYDQVQDQRDLHEDYETIVKPIMAEMESNPELKKRIWGSINPSREAYKYGKSKMAQATKIQEEADTKEKEKAEREKAIAQGQVEGSSTAPSKGDKRKLTDPQKRVARALGVTEEKYLKQLEAMEAKDANG